MENNKKIGVTIQAVFARSQASIQEAWTTSQLRAVNCAAEYTYQFMSYGLVFNAILGVIFWCFEWIYQSWTAR